MDVSRRGFLKVSLGSLMAGGAGVTLRPPEARADPPKVSYTRKTTSICPYCGVGCGMVLYTRDGKLVNVEGDPDHPINEGSLCSKGQSVVQISNKHQMGGEGLALGHARDRYAGQRDPGQDLQDHQ